MIIEVGEAPRYTTMLLLYSHYNTDNNTYSLSLYIYIYIYIRILTLLLLLLLLIIIIITIVMNHNMNTCNNADNREPDYEGGAGAPEAGPAGESGKHSLFY